MLGEARSDRETPQVIAPGLSSIKYKPRVLSADALELPAAKTAPPNPVGACLGRPDMSVLNGQAGRMDMEQLRRVALQSMMR